MKRWCRQAAAILALGACSCERRDVDPRAVTGVPPGVMVAHALGGVGGYAYTNSLEAFECNYERGFRWFEVDLTLTADGQLVCFHPGNENLVGLKKPLQQLTLAETAQVRYAGRYPVLGFSELLKATDRAGDVVLVTDTKTWSKAMIEAFERTVRASGAQRTRFALQSYGEQDIAAVKKLSDALHADILLTLYMSGADDPSVERLVKDYGVKAVVADMRRFTPWLAQRLHGLGVPVLVHTINDHRDIVRLARAGADGFYTDDYRPYSAAQPRDTVADCAYTKGSSGDLTEWTERDLLRPGDYALGPCARRDVNRVELTSCGDQPAVSGPNLAVPPGRTLHVEIDVGADPDGSGMWVEVVEKNRSQPARPREHLALQPSERRALTFDIALPNGSPGMEARLGLSSPADRLVIHRLNITHRGDGSDSGVVAHSRAEQPGPAE